jgi:mevalonate kinase
MGISNSASSPAKLLLFGEYAVLSGSEALAIPLANFKTTWLPGTESSHQFDLPEFAQFLQNLSLPFSFDNSSFKKHLEQGWYLESNIPQGYGLGSSGAVVATLLKQFGKDIDSRQPALLQQHLAKIESFFHGTSSGLDPLVCYLERAVHIQKGGAIKLLENSDNKLLNHFFLLDSGKPRQTAPLVQLYKRKLEQVLFKKEISDKLVPAQNQAIAAYLNEQEADLTECIAAISTLQLSLFEEMILPEFKQAWKEGIDTGKYYFKLCGAGGGGFFLIYSKEPASSLPFDLIPLY